MPCKLINVANEIAKFETKLRALLVPVLQQQLSLSDEGWLTRNDAFQK